MATGRLKVTLLVTGSVAAYKAVDVAAHLRRRGADVRAALSEAGARFASPLALEAVTGHAAVTELHAGGEDAEVHLSLAEADVVAVVPASADALARLALGLAGDVVGATYLAHGDRASVIAPAMETSLWRHPVTQEHVARLKGRGARFVGPVSGRLASGRSGEGRLADPEAIAAAIADRVAPQNLAGVRLLVTAGPTREMWDAVRFLSSPSTGRMGFAIAARAAARGAEVTLVHGPVALTPPAGVTAVAVTDAAEMLAAVRCRLSATDVLIGSAAVADYRPAVRLEGKFHKGPERLSLELERNPDILAEAAAVPGRRQRIHVGFAAETDEVVASARQKLEAKDLDLIVANDLNAEGAGFGVTTNRVTLIGRAAGAGPDAESLPLLPKEEVADRILDRVVALRRAVTAPA